MTEHVFDKVTTVSVTHGTDGCRVVLGIPDEPAPAPTDAVTTLKDFQTALNDGSPDITLSGTIFVTQDNPIIIPRNIARTIRGKATVQGNGQDFRIVFAPGHGGELRLYDFTVDGGWRANPGECTDDQAANLFLPNFDVLELSGVTTRYSRRTGIFATNSGRLSLHGCTGYALPRDFIWANGTQKFLAEDCLITYCCDDGIGCHLPAGISDSDREIIIRRNTLLGTLGIKVLGGGKSVLIEDNTIIAPGFYGIRLGLDPTTQEGAGDQRNITVRNNIIENVQKTSRCHPGQVQGVWLFMYAPNNRIENVSYIGNTLIRNSEDNGTKLRDMYLWASVGYYTKTGFDPDGVIDIGSESIRMVCSNPNTMKITGNTFKGF